MGWREILAILLGNKQPILVPVPKPNHPNKK
jgi:hypothetical protein